MACFVWIFDNFENAVLLIQDNAPEYFAAQESAKDLRHKLRSSRLYEALLLFLEHSQQLTHESSPGTLDEWSMTLAHEIVRHDQPWRAAANGLLVAKVAALNDLSARADY